MCKYYILKPTCNDNVEHFDHLKGEALLIIPLVSKLSSLGRTSSFFPYSDKLWPSWERGYTLWMCLCLAPHSDSGTD